MLKKILIAGMLFLVSAVMFPLSANAATYYVSTGGSDSSAGTLTSPWKTINASLSKLVAGDILSVRGGIYTEGSISNWPNGTATAPITVAAYPGETPIIDRQFINGTIWIGGNYTNFDGFEVRNTAGSSAITLAGTNIKLSHMMIHHNEKSGILFYGSNNILEDSVLYENVYQNCRHATHLPECPNGALAFPSGGWAPGIQINNAPAVQNTVIRRNTVYNNWGEGIGSFSGASGTLIEDNTVYDNFAANIYLEEASNSIVQRNLSYISSSIGDFLSTDKNSVFTTSNESANNPPASNNTVINNLFYGNHLRLFSWSYSPGGLRYMLFANNTLINSYIQTPDSTIGGVGNRFMNNIFTSSANTVPATAGITWSNNLWQGTRPALAVGTGDIVGSDPLLTKTGLTNGGQLTAGYFKLSSASSPAIDKAVVLAEVSADFFKTARETSPDIGAHEYNGGVPPTQYTLTVVQSANGTITPDTTTATSGGNQTFLISPHSGYQIASVIVDGISVGTVSSYIFTNIQAGHTITANFSATTDVTAPSIPAGLSATASSSSVINLAWTASTDNVGVTGYKIFRGGVQIGTSTTNSYSDTGLSAITTYSYTVSAYDAAGNNSVQSTSASATTQSTVLISQTLIIADVGNTYFKLGSGSSYKSLSQSFVAPASTLTNIQVGLSKSGSPSYSVTLVLKDGLSGTTLYSSIISPSQVTSTSVSAPTWITIAIPSSVALISGNTYYINLSVTTTSKQNYYRWSANSANPYTNGALYVGTIGQTGYDALAKIAHISTVAMLGTPSSAPVLLARQLERGNVGEDVSLLQRFLSSFDHVYPEKIVSGYFGNMTASAVSAFQGSHGLPSVGRVGPMTLQKLNELMGL